MQSEQMSGKICLVTGGSSGIGKATALELAQRGAHVVIVARDPERTEQAAAEIRRDSGNPLVDAIRADLSVQQQVRDLAAQIVGRYPRLDVLVNNAGVYLRQRQLTPDGMEMTLAVQYLAPFLLTNLLRDLLARSAPARIVNVSSVFHHLGRIDFGNLQGERFYEGTLAYAQSKVATILFTRELARRLAGSAVVANSMEPGAVATRIGRSAPLYFQLSLGLLWPVLRSPAEGARTIVHLACAPEAASVTGGHFVDCRERTPAPTGRDDALAQCLWAFSEQLTGLREAPLREREVGS
ncbi:MAG TPA: SDR family oxidoreductase [Roseiflexaceae bacterium]|nr:SDR family oxidoreductase [Roseiflexaceae bacterium]